MDFEIKELVCEAKEILTPLEGLLESLLEGEQGELGFVHKDRFERAKARSVAASHVARKRSAVTKKHEKTVPDMTHWAKARFHHGAMRGHRSAMKRALEAADKAEKAGDKKHAEKFGKIASAHGERYQYHQAKTEKHEKATGADRWTRRKNRHLHPRAEGNSPFQHFHTAANQHLKKVKSKHTYGGEDYGFKPHKDPHWSAHADYYGHADYAAK